MFPERGVSVVPLSGFDDCNRDVGSSYAELAIPGGRIRGMHVLLAMKKLNKQA